MAKTALYLLQCGRGRGLQPHPSRNIRTPLCAAVPMHAVAAALQYGNGASGGGLPPGRAMRATFSIIASMA
jgi:hypothetical protein